MFLMKFNFFKNISIIIIMFMEIIIKVYGTSWASDTI